MVQSHGSKTPFNKFCILTTTVIISLIIQSRYNNKAELKSYFAVTHIIVAVILSPNLLTISHISLFLSLQQLRINKCSVNSPMTGFDSGSSSKQQL